MPEAEKKCSFCGEHKEKLFHCSRCKSVLYCNRDHQKQHWKTHKVQCSQISRAIRAARRALPPLAEIGSNPKRVVIVGGGVIGCCLAYFLTRRGVQPIVIEREAIASAASGKAGGFLAQTWCDQDVRKELMRTSWELHQALNAELKGQSNYDFRTVETLHLGMEEPEHGKTRGAVSLPGQARKWKWIDGPTDDCGWMGNENNTAQVHPRKFTETIWKAAEERGAQLVMGKCEGVELTESENKNYRQKITGVRVNGEVIEGDAVIMAMGPWTGQAREWFGGGNSSPQVYGQKCHSICLKPKRPSKVSNTCLFVDFKGREFEPKNNIHPTYEFYPRTHGAEEEVYIHGMDERWRVPEEDGPADVVPTSGAMDRLRQVGAYTSSELKGAETLREQACYMPLVPDGMPLMGGLPGVEGAYLSTGHAEWGITLGPASALFMSQLILDGRSRFDMSGFRAERLPAEGYRLAHEVDAEREAAKAQIEQLLALQASGKQLPAQLKERMEFAAQQLGLSIKENKIV